MSAIEEKKEEAKLPPPTITLKTSQRRGLNSALDNAQVLLTEITRLQELLAGEYKERDEIVAEIEVENGLESGCLASTYQYNKKEFFKP